MNWEVIGTIAELIGAVAVVVSLVYLAIQIRQNTRQVEEQAKGQRFSVLGVLGDQWRGFRSNVIVDARAANVWRRGNEDLHQLDPDERASFDFLMTEFFWGFAYNWMMGVEEGLGTYVRDDLTDNLLIYDSPGIRAWWHTSPHRHQYPGDFVRFVDEMLAQPSSSRA